jgi:hypothetical protein
MPLAEPPPRDRRFSSRLKLSRVHWVRPEIMVEVTYLTWTEENLLRPCFIRSIERQTGQAGHSTGAEPPRPPG